MRSRSLLDLFSLREKVVILTGGAGFLAQQYAQALTEAGAKVVLIDNKSGGDVGSTRLSVDYIHADVTHAAEIRSAFLDVHKKYRRIDALINNAAMNPAVGDPNTAKMSGPYEEYPLSLWERELAVNMTGMQICTQEVVPFMMEARRGSIVNVASEVSVIAYDWTDVYPEGKFKSPAYIASKHGVIGITRAWAAYLGKYGVRVNSFSPGGVETNKMPADFVERYSRKNMLGSMAQEGDYDAHIVFLCSDASARITGHNLIADGGKSAW